jgi:hypothetical protein
MAFFSQSGEMRRMAPVLIDNGSEGDAQSSRSIR